MTKNEITIVMQLRRQGIGYRRIAEVTKLPINTIKSYCRRHPVEETQGTDCGDTVCRQCGAELVFVPHRKPKKFCSDGCRMSWWNSHRDLVEKKAYKSFSCVGCGQVFAVYGEAERKFCTKKCYEEYRRKAAGK